MTDEQIIKALENAKAVVDHNDIEVIEFFEQAIDLINRQKAEIERLKAMHSEMCIGMKVLKRNAIEKFAERLKVMATSTFWEETSCVSTDEIDNLAKEMVGE